MMGPLRHVEEKPVEESMASQNTLDGTQAVVHINSDSEVSENEQGNEAPDNAGYQLLPGEPPASAGLGIEHDLAGSETPVIEEEEWGASTPSSSWHEPDFLIPHQPRWNSVNLDADKVEDIKARMASFALPEGQHPSWAKDVDEEEWKNHLLERIRNKDEGKASDEG